MIEVLSGFPGNVVAVRASGTVTRRDYEEGLIPAANAALARHQKVRVYYETAADFAGFEAGAIWEDFSLGMGHLGRWDRVAVVTDADWIRHATQALAFLVPCHVRVFALADAALAREWVTL